MSGKEKFFQYIRNEADITIRLVVQTTVIKTIIDATTANLKHC